jgi:hypothetical protein
MSGGRCQVLPDRGICVARSRACTLEFIQPGTVWWLDHSETEVEMTLARVVAFEGVNRARIDELKREMEDGEPPAEIPVKEMIMLHDADGEKSLVILFFENEDDYKRGDEALNAMPTDDTPGRRASVTKYDVALHMKT